MTDLGGSELSTEQQKPVPNDSPSVQGMVRADLETREQLGRQRYGTPLQPHNGRDALRDAYEEALDLSCYLRQAIEERPREDVDAAVSAVRAELQPELNRRADLNAELRRQYNAADRVRNSAVAESRRQEERAEARQARLNRVISVLNRWQNWRKAADDGAPFAELYDQVLVALTEEAGRG